MFAPSLTLMGRDSASSSARKTHSMRRPTEVAQALMSRLLLGSKISAETLALRSSGSSLIPQANPTNSFNLLRAATRNHAGSLSAAR